MFAPTARGGRTNNCGMPRSPRLSVAPGPARLPRSPRVLLLVDFIATIYANDNYGVWQSDFHGLVMACVGLGGAPGEIAGLLHPQASDITILKPRHSAFYASALELLLTEMHAQELVICGIATDMCVQITAGDAFLREYPCWVPADCTAAENQRAKKASLAYMASVLKCDVRPSTSRPPRLRPVA
jgi:hypothetical protein